MIGDYLDNYTFKYLITQALQQVPNTLDKREGSIMYDALAPVCYELASYYQTLKQLLQDTYALTAEGEYLDLRVMEQGITRYSASPSTRAGYFYNQSGGPMEIPYASTWSTMSDTETVNFFAIGQLSDENGVPVPGKYRLGCNNPGTIGNDVMGELIPISYVNGFGRAELGEIIRPGQDIETDDELRQRYLQALKKKSFGGNVAQYKELLKSIEGIGAAQIYPTWNGGGTVLCSVVDSTYSINSIAPSFLTEIKEKLDPEPSGKGLGLVPIGHTVEITVPEITLINFEMSVVLKTGIDIENVKDIANVKLEEYIQELRQHWGEGTAENDYTQYVYLSRVTAIVMGISGVEAVNNVKLNSQAQNFIIPSTSTTQYLPTLGIVILNEQ